MARSSSGRLRPREANQLPSAAFVHVYIVPGRSRIADDAEGKLHLVVLGIGQFEEEDRIGIIRPGADLDTQKRKPGGRDDGGEAFPCRVMESISGQPQKLAQA